EPTDGGARPDSSEPGARLRGRSQGRAAERADGPSGGGQGRARHPARRSRPQDRRGDELRAPSVGTPAGRCRGVARPGRPPGSHADAGARAQRAGPRPGARRRGSAHRDLRQRHGDLRPAQPEPLPGGAVLDVRADRRSCASGGDGRTGLCVDVLRGSVGGPGARRPGRRRRETPAGARDLPALPRRHHRGGHPRPRDRAARRLQRSRGRRRPARHALPRHLRAGPHQHLRRPAPRGHDLRRQCRRPRWLPVRRVRHRKPRHRGPGLDAGRTRHRDRHRSRLVGRDEQVAGRTSRAAQPQPRRQRPPSV
ncbi:MAG: Hydroxymethylglutaryl-CoA lyase, partial [uncultured Nocardioidaceae bacterium]